MDIEECRKIAGMGWPENQKAQRQHDAVDWLIVEVDRLSTENSQKESEIGEITEEVVSLRNERDFYKCRGERAFNLAMTNEKTLTAIRNLADNRLIDNEAAKEG